MNSLSLRLAFALPFKVRTPRWQIHVVSIGRLVRAPLLVLLAFTLADVHLRASAQSTRTPQIGYLNTPRSSAERPGLLEPFQQGLRELGYTEGQNIKLQVRIGEGARQLVDFAAELVRLKVDVIVAHNPAPIAAAMSATKTIPIVATFNDDPVFFNYVETLERPGRNVTGVGGLTPELGGKWVELIKDIIPSAKRIAVFWNNTAEDKFPVSRSVESAAGSFGIDLKWSRPSFPAPTRFSFKQRLRFANWKDVDAFIVLPGVTASRTIQDIAEYGLYNRLPGIFWQTDFALDHIGGLMAYSANRSEQSRRSAYIVDKILKGAKAAELPVELPKSFELVINLKTANQIGIIIPPRVLAWADRVIK
jgi:putative tryptophan/tyrosine transport system substrate-binding protein